MKSNALRDEASRRRAWEKPRLTALGDIRETTAGSTGQPGDCGGRFTIIAGRGKPPCVT